VQAASCGLASSAAICASDSDARRRQSRNCVVPHTCKRAHARVGPDVLTLAHGSRARAILYTMHYS
jgi:hypothetical protein